MHGGDIYRNQIAYDFSVNVNPLGVPQLLQDAMTDALSKVDCYPDPRCEALRRGIGTYYGLSNPDQIVCGNGASELLHAICRWAGGEKDRKAMLIAPCFLGYSQALRSEAYRIVYTTVSRIYEDVERKTPSLLFVANPNNPDGYLWKKEDLWRLLELCRKVGTLLVIDECFIELTDRADNTMISNLGDDHLLILRAFTKSMAIPGVRLGYLLCGNGEIAAQIKDKLPEWNVSVIAQAAGEAAIRVLKESDYRERTLSCIRVERAYLEEALQKLGMKVIKSNANYILFHDPLCAKRNLYKALLEQGVLIRMCNDYQGLGEGYFRIAVKTHPDNQYLIDKMKELVEGGHSENES